MDIENREYDGSFTATLVGRAGLFKGEEAVLHLGQCLVVGRSRMCNISVARTAECLRLGKEALERHRSYRKISRKHLRVCLTSADRLEVEDLSTNGTVVDGYRIDKVVVSGFRDRSGAVIIEFGDGEILEVEAKGPAERGSRRRHDEHESIETRHPEDVHSGLDRTPVP